VRYGISLERERERCAGVWAESYAIIVSSFGGWRWGFLVDGGQDAASDEALS
jgi:hypothetical protein